MFTKLTNQLPLLIVILFAAFVLTSCGENTNTAPAANESSSTQTTPATQPKTGFEADLDYIRKGGFTYIWIFSRKDGKPLDKDDSAYLRKNAPQVVDWVTTDEGKKVIAGTNFDLQQGNLGLLKKRFLAEDYTGR